MVNGPQWTSGVRRFILPRTGRIIQAVVIGPLQKVGSKAVRKRDPALGNRPKAGFFPCPKKEKLSVLQNHSESEKIL
jgi:hypothetical protein